MSRRIRNLTLGQGRDQLEASGACLQPVFKISIASGQDAQKQGLVFVCRKGQLVKATNTDY